MKDKKFKLYIGTRKLDSHVCVREFRELKALLNTTDLDLLDSIRFGDDLEGEEDLDENFRFDLLDCAREIVKYGKGNKLPQIFVEKSPDRDKIIEELNSYTLSYKHDNLCASISAKL